MWECPDHCVHCYSWESGLELYKKGRWTVPENIFFFCHCVYHSNRKQNKEKNGTRSWILLWQTWIYCLGVEEDCSFQNIGLEKPLTIKLNGLFYRVLEDKNVDNWKCTLITGDFKVWRHKDCSVTTKERRRYLVELFYACTTSCSCYEWQHWSNGNP